MFGAWNLQTSVGDPVAAPVPGTLFLMMTGGPIVQGRATPRFMGAATVGAPVLHFLAIVWARRIGGVRRERSESAS